MIRVGTSVGAPEGLDRLAQPLGVVGVADVQHVPAIGEEARRDIVAEGQVGVSLDGDAVAVVDPAQVAEHLMAGERGRLARDALHHVAVAADGIDVVVEHRKVRPVEMLGEPAPGDRHADAVAAALAERPGRGLDAGGQVIFRMAGALAAELAEPLDVVERDRGLAEPLVFRVDGLDAGEMQQRSKAASRHGRSTARSGRGWARSDRRDRSAETLATACKPPAPAPSACRDGRIAPAARRPSPGCEWC